MAVMMRSSQSMPVLGLEPQSPSAAFAQASAASNSGSSPTKSASGPPNKFGKGSKRPQFKQTQFYSAPFDVAYEELAKARNLHKLEILFIEADTDGSGEMSLDEFKEAMLMPKVQRAFAVLGVQPHQSELVFKSLDKRKTGELSITEFMGGLTALVGTDMSGKGSELDIEKLKPAYQSKMRHLSVTQKRTPAEARAASAPKLGGSETKASNLDLGPVHLLPKLKVQRAFVASASSSALHSATATKHKEKGMMFPF